MMMWGESEIGERLFRLVRRGRLVIGRNPRLARRRARRGRGRCRAWEALFVKEALLFFMCVFFYVYEMSPVYLWLAF